MSARRLQDFFQSFSLIKEIGTGANSVVHECRNLRGGKFAVKVSNQKFIDLEMLQDEVEILSHVKHDNVIGFEGMYKSIEDPDLIYTVLELVSGGDLHDLINTEGAFAEKDALPISFQIAKALHYLHTEKNICHRDIKPENVLVTDDGIAKLTDFGLAIELKDENSKIRDCVGTQAYQAPEVLLNLDYDKSVDMWALGATVYTMLAGSKPFGDESNSSQKARILNGEYDFNQHEWKFVSEEAKDFIRSCLQIKPSQRLTADAAMHHPWLEQEIDMSKFRNKWRDRSRDRHARLREMRDREAKLRKQEDALVEDDDGGSAIRHRHYEDDDYPSSRPSSSRHYDDDRSSVRSPRSHSTAGTSSRISSRPVSSTISVRTPTSNPGSRTSSTTSSYLKPSYTPSSSSYTPSSSIPRASSSYSSSTRSTSHTRAGSSSNYSSYSSPRTTSSSSSYTPSSTRSTYSPSPSRPTYTSSSARSSPSTTRSTYTSTSSRKY